MPYRKRFSFLLYYSRAVVLEDSIMFRVHARDES